MISFDHILLPFDGSDSSVVALNNALFISNKFNSKITAVFVRQSESDNGHLEIKEKLKAISAEENKEILFLHPVGKMYKEVVKTVEEVGADLILMGTHGISGFEEFWIGSNAYRVVSSSPVPVITMQETFEKVGFSKIIVPIDQSKETRQKIPMVMHLANIFDSDIHFLGATKYSDNESQAKVKRYVKQSIEMLEEEELKSEVTYSFGQNIAKATLQNAKEVDADLIIMMSESEPSSGLFMGSNAQQIVNHSAVPVLTLHPKDVGIAIAGY